ncbi:unnamed protein product [Prorocentrum cordatum]|uniref:Calmodulin n=1 Tax=Prorocentrum cordatum TaxID=2364126 RepID=A0ABN9TE75_9DINO|nr:unnamed protein product [Polarella glacialis]
MVGTAAPSKPPPAAEDDAGYEECPTKDVILVPPRTADGRWELIHPVTLEQQFLPQPVEHWQLDVDDDGWACLSDVGSDETILPEVVLKRCLEVDKHGERFYSEVRKGKTVRFSLYDLQQKYRTLTVTVGIGAIRAAVSLQTFYLPWPLPGNLHFAWNAHNVYTVLQLTSYKKQPSKWAFQSSGTWRRHCSEFGLSRQILHSSHSGEGEDRTVDADYFLPATCLSTFGLLQCLARWTQKPPQHGGLHARRDAVEELLRGLLADTVEHPKVCKALDVHFSDDFRWTWPEPRPQAHVTLSVLDGKVDLRAWRDRRDLETSSGIMSRAEGAESLSKPSARDVPSQGAGRLQGAARPPVPAPRLEVDWDLVLLRQCQAWWGLLRLDDTSETILLRDLFCLSMRYCTERTGGPLFVQIAVQLAHCIEKDIYLAANYKSSGSQVSAKFDSLLDLMDAPDSLNCALLRHVLGGVTMSEQFTSISIVTDKGNACGLTLDAGGIFFPNNTCAIAVPQVAKAFRTPEEVEHFTKSSAARRMNLRHLHWLRRNASTAKDKGWRPRPRYRVSTRKWIESKDNIIAVGTRWTGLADFQRAVGKGPWRPEGWRDRPHLNMAQDRGGDGASAVQCLAYKLGINVTEWWDEDHDVNNDIMNAYKATGLFPLVLTWLCRQNLMHGPEKDKDMRFNQFTEMSSMVFKVFTHDSCASFREHSSGILSELKGEFEPSTPATAEKELWAHLREREHGATQGRRVSLCRFGAWVKANVGLLKDHAGRRMRALVDTAPTALAQASEGLGRVFEAGTSWAFPDASAQVFPAEALLVQSCSPPEQEWELMLWKLEILCVEMDFLGTGKFATTVLKSTHAEAAGDLSGGTTAACHDGKVLRSCCQNAAVVSLVLMSVRDNRRRIAIMTSLAVPLVDASGGFNRDCRSVGGNLAWARGQVEGRFMDTLRLVFGALLDDDTLSECGFEMGVLPGDFDEHREFVEDQWANLMGTLCLRMVGNRTKRRSFMFGWPHKLIGLVGEVAPDRKQRILDAFRNDLDSYEAMRRHDKPGEVKWHLSRSQFKRANVEQYVDCFTEKQWLLDQESGDWLSDRFHGVFATHFSEEFFGYAKNAKQVKGSKVFRKPERSMGMALANHLPSKRHRYVEVDDGVPASRKKARLSAEAFGKTPLKPSVDLGGIATTHAAAPYYSPKAVNLATPVGDLHLVRYCKEFCGFSKLSNAVCSAASDCLPFVLRRKDTDPPTKGSTWYLGLGNFPNSAAIAWQIQLKAVPGHDDFWYVDPTNDNVEPVFLPMVDLDDFLVRPFEWRSPAWQRRHLKKAPPGWHKGVRMIVYAAEDIPLKTLAARECFWNWELSFLVWLAKMFGIPVRGHASSLLEVIVSLIMGILECSEDEALGIAKKRVAALVQDTVALDELLEIEEAEKVLTNDDIEKLHKEQKKYAARKGVQDDLVREFTVVQMSRRKAREEAEAKAAKKEKKDKKDKKDKTDKKAPPPEPVAPTALPIGIDHKDANKYKPPGSYIWRSFRGQAWQGRVPPAGIVSRSWQKYGGYNHALRELIKELWKVHCVLEGYDPRECPMAGVFDQEVLAPMDVAPWFLNNVLKHMIGNLRMHGILWCGKSRVGKSNCSKTLAFLHSAFNVQRTGSDAEIAFLTVKHMDFFKAEPTTEVLPGIFDDGLLQKVPADILKAFLNPKEEDAWLWARWGGCAFEQRSSRQAVANPYDREAERAALAAATLGKYSLGYLEKIVAPSLEAVDDEEDLHAILGRANVVVVADTGVHWRVASADLQVGAEYMQWPDPACPDLFNEDKRDHTSPAIRPMPADFEEKMQWSIGYMQNLVDGQDVPTVAAVRVASVFGDRPDRVESVVGGVSGYVQDAASARAPPAAAAASGSDGAASGHIGAVDAAGAERGGSGEEDVFGLGGDVDADEEEGPSSPRASRAPCSIAAQPPIVGCHGELSAEDRAEQVAIFRSLARAHRGALEDLSPPPPTKKPRRLMMGCGGPLSPVDADEQAAIFASLAASAHGEQISIDDDADLDLEGEIGRMLVSEGVVAPESAAGGEASGSAAGCEASGSAAGGQASGSAADNGLIGAGFKDCCGIDALNALGLDVPYLRDGLFSINDARAMVASDGRAISPAFIRGARGAPPGRYIATYGSAPGLVGHAVAVLIFREGFIVFDGDARACYAGHVSWHCMPGGVRAEACDWWQVLGA